MILTGTLRYETMTTYTGSDIEIAAGNFVRPMSARFALYAPINSWTHCRSMGEIAAFSWTTANTSGGVNRYALTGAIGEFVDVFVDGVYDVVGVVDSGTILTITGLTCLNIEG